MTNSNQPRRILPHHVPASPQFASKHPGLFTPEKVAASIETLRLGIEQFKAELAAGPLAPDAEPTTEFARPINTEGFAQTWISSQTRQVSEWEELLAGYLELQAKQA